MVESRKVPIDYSIHRSPTTQPNYQSITQMSPPAKALNREAQPSQFDPTLAPHPPVPYPVSNPGWWEQTYRRVPDYRPVNRELDREQRRQSPLFAAVGVFMIGGCSLIANWSSLWRNTVGRVTRFGDAKIGGEW